ncbi:MAG: hypothetical protein AAF399_14325 [Bacteroidota bacterium]
MQKPPLLIVIAGMLMFLIMASFKPESPVPQQYPRWVVEHDTLLEIVDEFGLRPEHPTTFIFQLEEGDSIFFECPDFDYLIDRRKVTFTWFTPETSINFGPSLINNGTTIQYGGTYRLQVQIKNKIAGKQRNFDKIEHLVIHRYRENQRNAYQPENFLNIENLYIGNEAEGKNRSNPIFRLFVGKGDSLAFTFTPTDQANVDNLVIELTNEFGGNPVPYRVDASGLVSLPHARAVRSGFQQIQFKTSKNKTLFKRERDFYNLTAERIPTLPKQYSSSGGIMVGGEMPEATGEEGQATTVDALMAMAEALKQQAYEDIELIDGQTINSIPVAGTMQLNHTNRACRPLNIQASDVFVLWLGVGEEAMDEYKAINTYQKELNSRESGDILTRYARSVLLRGRANHNLFRGEGDSEDVFNEYIEYAILDEGGKERFLKGELPSTKYVNQDHDHFTNLGDRPIYLCLCNQNRVSSVKVAFRYAMFNRYTEE